MLSLALDWLSPPFCSLSIGTSAPLQLENAVVDETPLTSSGTLPGCGDHACWQPGPELLLYAWGKGQRTESTL